jgi:antitoxin CptB
MRSEDRGARSEELPQGLHPLNPQSSIPDPEVPILDPVSLERVRWRCRRGLLELDIVLGRFVRQRYSAMDNEQRVIFDELLDMPDTELWDVITGKKEPAHAHQREVLEWLKEA